MSDLVRGTVIEDDALALLMSDELDWPLIEDEGDIQFDESAARSIGLRKCLDANIIPILLNRANAICLASPDDDATITWLKDTHQYASFCIAPMHLLKTRNNFIIKPLIAAESSSEYEGDSMSALDTETKDITDISATGIDALIATMVGSAIDFSASDIQIIPTVQDATIYFRVDGKRLLYTRIAKNAVMPIVNILINMAGLGTAATFALRAGKVLFSYNGTEIPMRINVIPTRQGNSINLRLLSNKISSYEQLGASPLLVKTLANLEDISQGLILVVGPTGSGKSTTMLSFISRLLTHNINICTAEDPVEVVIPGINQVDIQESTVTSYSEALKAFMRHDPDVIMIGEIRDLETAQIALQASDTGHLIISTIHTKDAISSVSRLIGMGVAKYSIVESLVAVVAQRLVRRVCPHCKKSHPMPVDHEYRKLFSLDAEKYKDVEIKMTKGTGCSFCKNTGYRGRLVIAECMLSTRALREAIENSATTDVLRNIVEQDGFVSMMDDGIEKAIAGETSFEEISSLMHDAQLRGL